MRLRTLLSSSAACALGLSACGGGGGGGGEVASTPTPAPAPVPVPPPPPPPPPPSPPPASFDTAEYRRSNAAVQANALAAYNAGATGAGVIAGVIDSGIDVGSIEFPRIHPNSADLAGSRGLQAEGEHGTVVSQILLGAKNDLRTHGVAFNATLLVLRTDSPGSCAGATAENDCSHDDNNIARGVDLARTTGARVVNISLGGSPANNNLRNAIDRATAAGIIIVISAGNDSQAEPDSLAQVANDPQARGLVIIAGATDSSQQLASFSNRAGASAARYLTALGSRILFTDNTGVSFRYSGTSFSAPVISGAVALIAQAFPSLSAAQIVDLLMRTATDLGAPGTDSTYGRGEINLARAFAPVGSTSLSKTAELVTLTGSNASLSPAMGDAAKSGLVAQIRDEYARDFTVDLLPTVERAPLARRLAPALQMRDRQLGVTAGATTLALSIDDRARPMGLTLDRANYSQARALAGLVATKVGRAELAMGFARSGSSLLGSRAAGGRAAFLVADETTGGQSLARAPKAAFAVRRDVAGFGVSVNVETGKLGLLERSDISGLRDAWRDYRYDAIGLAAERRFGPLDMRLGVTRFGERDTVLGGRFASALGGGGATSWFADVQAAATPLASWRLSAQWRRGWTEIPGRLGRDASTLTSEALAFDVTRDDLFGGALSLRWSRPLRVTGGGLALTGLGDPVLLSLAPQGRETDLEAVFERPLWGGGLSFNAFRRTQPGHYAFAPADTGAAVRWSAGF